MGTFWEFFFHENLKKSALKTSGSFWRKWKEIIKKISLTILEIIKKKKKKKLLGKFIAKGENILMKFL